MGHLSQCSDGTMHTVCGEKWQRVPVCEVDLSLQKIYKLLLDSQM